MVVGRPPINTLVLYPILCVMPFTCNNRKHWHHTAKLSLM
jgi:hypothetical protein